MGVCACVSVWVCVCVGVYCFCFFSEDLAALWRPLLDFEKLEAKNVYVLIYNLSMMSRNEIDIQHMFN